MLHELRCYTTLPGMAGELVKANEEIGRKVRGDNYGVLEGYWVSEIGPLNQVWHLWRYDSFEERERLRKEMGELTAWKKDYLPRIRPHIVNQETRFLSPIRERNKPKGSGYFYELRTYRLQPGAAVEWVKRAKKMLPAREKYSPCVFMWTNQAPNPNEVTHLWAYKDFKSRMKARGDAAEDPAFKAFAKFARPLTIEQTSTLLVPAPFSPLR